MVRIDVQHARGRYAIEIDRGLLSGLGERIAALGLGRALLAIDERIAASHGQTAQESLRNVGIDAAVHLLCAQEKHKSLAAVEAMYDKMLQAKLDRSSLVIAMGGGIVGDLAGFAAATFMRGIALVQAPTTLLAMVDASIGGKTGVNLPLPDGSLVKNIVGAFWPPLAVLSDPAVLSTLDPRDFRCGLAECVKHGMIADQSLLRWIDDHATALAALDEPALATLIARCTVIKAKIVQQDERENDQRALLNLGHTFAHAFESMPELQLRHGEAVSIGLSAAMHVSVLTGRMNEGQRVQLASLLTKIGLPVSLPQSGAPTSRLLQAMGRDKKAVGGRQRLVLPVGVGDACIADDVAEAEIVAALQVVGARE